MDAVNTGNVPYVKRGIYQIQFHHVEGDPPRGCREVVTVVLVFQPFTVGV